MILPLKFKRTPFQFFRLFIHVEYVKKIVRQELQKLQENSGASKIPVFNDPQAAMEYAIRWQRKAVKGNEFYWKIDSVVKGEHSPEEKISLIIELLPNYGWV